MSKKSSNFVPDFDDMQGLIIRTTGSAYHVLLDNGQTIEAHVKGKFRISGIRSTNPVAVGDRIEVQMLDDGTNWITAIGERRNYIVRRSTNLSKESHILAANLDQVALLVTLRNPETSLTFVDRFLATAEAYRVPAVLVFNKVDLLSEDELAQLADIRSLYESLGYPTYAISARNLEKDDPVIRSIFFPGKGAVTLLSGNSGVGKSTLLNRLFGREVTRTGMVSDVHHKGMHTTTFSEMYFLPSPDGETEGARIIDTPGIKGFGTIEMDRYEIGHYFREIFAISADCRFGNCLHTGEPGCAVEPAVVDGRIAVSRFESYLSLLGDCDEGKYR